jgi:hypothetical protein
MMLFLFSTLILSSTASNTISSIKPQIIPQTRFQAPIDTHLIEVLNNIPSFLQCAAICERHSICRTADYTSATNVCRLFETIVAAGTLLSDPLTKVIAFNYCPNDQQIELEFICTRSGTLSVQQMFDRLAVATNFTLSTTDRGAYANLQGVYTSSNAGDLSFFPYDGGKSTLGAFPEEVTNINSATRNGLVVVQYSIRRAIIYINTGNAWQPHLVPTLTIPLIAASYACLLTSQYLYITYLNGTILLTIHNSTTGSILFNISSNYGAPYRPTIAQWNDSLIILDNYLAMEYTLNGTYTGNLPYFTGVQTSQRHYVHYDYAGRRYTCNYSGSNSGIYAFLFNGTRLANGPSFCQRAFQVYITKEQAILVHISPAATMQVINF